MRRHRFYARKPTLQVCNLTGGLILLRFYSRSFLCIKNDRLTLKKILPGLFHRFLVGQMPEGGRIIGSARSDLSQAEFRQSIGEALAKFAPTATDAPDQVAAFLERLDYIRVDATGEKGWDTLSAAL